MKRFHFSFGDSSKGPVGYCAAIEAETPEQAVELLKKQMPEQWEVNGNPDEEGHHELDYIEVYFNTDAITVKDIDEVIELDDKTAPAAGGDASQERL